MTRILRDAEVRACLTPGLAVDLVARGVVDAWSREHRAAARSTARTDGGWLRTTSGALVDQDVLGFKAFALVPGHGVRYLVSLYRLSDGQPLALIDANHLTVARTSAAAAAAARRYWADRPLRVGVIGSGVQARDGLRALAAVCAVQEASVHSPREERRTAFATELETELELSIRPVASPREATAGADMVLCATQTPGTVALVADDVGPATYVSSVSSTLPAQRELDARVLATASQVVVDTIDALEESGDLIAAGLAGLSPAHVVTLGEYLSTPPLTTGGRTVYKSIGSVEQDLAAAAAVWRRAMQLGIGEEIAPIETLKPV